MTRIPTYKRSRGIGRPSAGDARYPIAVGITATEWDGTKHEGHEDHKEGELMKKSCLLLFFALLASCSLCLRVSTTAAADRPNILLIVSDDQGWPDLGCIGTKPIQTPHLDRLAKQGVRLTNYYVTWPACTPSRASILTGRHPLRNGLNDMVRNDLVNYGHRYTPQE